MSESSDLPESNIKCKTVLIVEDDESIRETLRIVISMEGYSVQTATNGREALSVLSKM